MDDFPFNDTPSLLKEVERLKAERDKADAKAHTWSQRCLVFEAKIVRLEAERDWWCDRAWETAVYLEGDRDSWEAKHAYNPEADDE